MSANANALIKLNHLSPKIAVNSGAGAATIVPTYSFGQYLNTHGIWVLSYAEWIKVIGCVWISLLIVEFLAKNIKLLISKAKK